MHPLELNTNIGPVPNLRRIVNELQSWHLSEPRKLSPNAISPPPLPFIFQDSLGFSLDPSPYCDGCWAPQPGEADPMWFRGATPHSPPHVALKDYCWNSGMEILPISLGKSVLDGNWMDWSLGRCAELDGACLLPFPLVNLSLVRR